MSLAAALQFGPLTEAADDAEFATRMPLPRRRRARAEAIAQYRLERFAEVNGATFAAEAREPVRSGRIFGVGILQRSSDIVSFGGDRPIEVGTHRYSSGYLDSEPFVWGYATTVLHAPVPALFVDPKRVRGRAWRSLPHPIEVALGSPQLDPGFDRRYTVSARIGTTATARSIVERAVFEPAMLARLEAEEPLGLEVVDDRLFVYRWMPFDLAAPETWIRLLSLVDDLARALEDEARGRERPAAVRA
ncbi:hypothetical protein [Agromyces sp. LHK192]|uniref:hypothetical protein n=1 Tax=Agromyces sp. LHK192 TaxID=2498704 RepID=UPI000FD8B8ED|nr:hypothetical protein [Agromyces sp. LHK192]